MSPSLYGVLSTPRWWDTSLSRISSWRSQPARRFLISSFSHLIAFAWEQRRQRRRCGWRGRSCGSPRHFVARALLLSALISTSLLALQLPIVDVALWMIPASAEAEAHARTFFLIRIWAMPAALATYAFVGWLYGLEDARIPLVLQIVTNLINIALDFLFVFGFEWGVAGVAAAGLVADFAGLAIAIVVISRRLKRFDGATTWAQVADGARMRRMLAINRDIFMRTFCVVSTSAIFIARSAELGDLEAAANQILLNFLMFTSFGMDGIAFAAEALIGGDRSRQFGPLPHRRPNRLGLDGRFRGGECLDLLAVRIADRLFDDGYRDGSPNGGDLPRMVDCDANRIVFWAFSFDGIFIGATRTKTLRNTMFVAFAAFLLIVFGPFAELNNHLLWLAFFIFLTMRGALLAACYPRLRSSLERTGTSQNRNRFQFRRPRKLINRYGDLII